jgi:hypothetical protein
VTYHHNYFVNTDGRNPSLRFGAVHMFNNYYGNITDYGLAARDGAHAKVENCHYENVKLPMSTDKFPVDGLPNGYICQSGNTFSGTCGANVISQTGCDFWNSTTLPYSYTPDPVTTVKATVQQYAGLGNNPTVEIVSAATQRTTNQQKNRVSPFLTGYGAPPVGQELFDLSGRSLAHNSSREKTGGRIILLRKSPEKLP